MADKRERAERSTARQRGNSISRNANSWPEALTLCSTPALRVGRVRRKRHGARGAARFFQKQRAIHHWDDT